MNKGLTTVMTRLCLNGNSCDNTSDNLVGGSVSTAIGGQSS
jgi:hypothetical protein